MSGDAPAATTDAARSNDRGGPRRARARDRDAAAAAPSEWPAGGSEMARRVRAFDWAATPLGPVAGWPLSLRAVAQAALSGGFPMVVLWGPELTQIYNDPYAALLGGRHPAALGRPARETWHEVWHLNEPLLARVTGAGETVTFEDSLFRVPRRAGGPAEDAWFTVSSSPLRDDAGAVAGALVTAVETSARVRAVHALRASGDALRASEERRHLALEAAELGTFLWHVAEDRTEADPRMLALFGLAGAGELTLREALATLIHPDDRAPYAAAVARATDPAGDGVLRAEIRVYPRGADPAAPPRCLAITGRTRFEGAPPRQSRRAVRMYGVAADVTERREAQEALARANEALARANEDLERRVRERTAALASRTAEAERAGQSLRASEARLQAVVAHAAVGLSEIALDGRFRMVNDELCRFLARPRAELLALGVPDVTHPEDVPASAAKLRRVLETGEPQTIDKRYLRPDGSTVWASSSVSLLRDADGRPSAFLAVTADLTERRRAEEDLRVSEARFRAVADLVPDLLWSSDAGGVVNWFNRRWAEYTGQSAATEATDHRWLDVVHPDDREGSLARFAAAIAAGAPLEMEYRIRRAGDGAYRWFLVRAEPVRDERGRVTRWFGASTDIHDQRTARDTLEEQVRERTRALTRRSEELARMNEMRHALVRQLVTAQEEERQAVAFELHDGLTQYVMTSHAYLEAYQAAAAAGNAEAAAERLRKGLAYLKVAVTESRRLVNGLHTLALDDMGLAGALELLLQEEKAHAGWRAVHFVHNLAGRRYDPVLETAVFRVAQEAVGNARKHARADEVSVTLTARDEPGGARGGEGAVATSALELEVRDGGVGFRPSEKLSEYGRLGLHSMSERAALLGGTCELVSAPGKGTVVRATFPVRDSPRRAARV